MHPINRYFLLITLASTALAYALYFLERSPIIHDAFEYYQLAVLITQRGLFDYAIIESASYRTYGYPSFVAFFASIFGTYPEQLHFVIFNAQLLLLLITCFYCAQHLAKVLQSPYLAIGLYASTALNVILLIHTIEFLSEMLSAVLVYLTVIFVLRGNNSGTQWVVTRQAFLSFLCASLASIVRPANTAVLLAAILIWMLRISWFRDVPWRAVFFICIAIVLPFFPQLVINYNSFGVVSPLTERGLYFWLMRQGAWQLKFGTVVMPDEPPLLLYLNPFFPMQLAIPDIHVVLPDVTWVMHNPPIYVVTLVLHGFAFVDQDFPFTYIRELDPWYRWPLSIANYVFLGVAIFGVYQGLYTKKTRQGDRNIRFVFIALLIACTFYILLYLPTRPENRYSLPVYLLLSLGFVYGLNEMMSFLRGKRWKAAATVGIAGAMLLGGSVWLSAWIQDQAFLCSSGSAAGSYVRVTGCKDLTGIHKTR